VKELEKTSRFKIFHSLRCASQIHQLGKEIDGFLQYQLPTHGPYVKDPITVWKSFTICTSCVSGRGQDWWNDPPARGVCCCGARFGRRWLNNYGIGPLPWSRVSIKLFKPFYLLKVVAEKPNFLFVFISENLLLVLLAQTHLKVGSEMHLEEVGTCVSLVSLFHKWVICQIQCII